MLRRLEDKFVGVLSDRERTVLRHGAAWFFTVLLGYYTLRPIREQIGTEYGIKNLSWLFQATFVAMLIAIPIYSWLVSKFDRRILVPCIYAFFLTCLLGFWGVMRQLPTDNLPDATDASGSVVQVGDIQPDADNAEPAVAPTSAREWTARVLFIWISVYGLFVVSFFWSVIGDMMSSSQGNKVFGFVAGGGTVGGLIASRAVSLLVERFGQTNLLLIPLLLLVVGFLIYRSLERSIRHIEANDDIDDAVQEKNGKATGGNPFAGFTAIFKSKYLFAICLYGFFFAACGTTIYFQQAEIVTAAYAPDHVIKDESQKLAVLQGQRVKFEKSYGGEVAGKVLKFLGKEREIDLNSEDFSSSENWQLSQKSDAETKYFANVNFGVQILTLFLQIAVVGRLMTHFGLGVTLALVPIAYVIGITSLALEPTIFVLAIITVTGRSAEYAIANPAREVLFTAVNREDRYKAKSFIDTVVRRGGDSLVGGVYRTLRGGSVAMTTLSWCVLPIAVAWIGLALFIGKENKKVIEEKESHDLSEASSED